MSNVFVLDTNKRPLDPVHPGRARLLLSSGKAAVFKRYPFTIILKHEVQSPPLEPLRLKFDPGSKTAELTHRGHSIKKALSARRGVRRSRRQRHTRYRKPRFKNRRRPEGWLAPSLESRVCNVLTWVRRLMRLCPIAALSLELVKFDMQAMENPEISGVEYQQGTSIGYELREYLLEKWNRACAYCGATGVPLQVEHIQSRAKGGSNRASNLCLACERCNLEKGTQDIVTFLAHKPEVLARILAMDKHGFPRSKAKQKQFKHGFHTGDIVRAYVPSHLKNPGRHVGRMSAKANGAFTTTTGAGTVTDIGKKYCRTLQRADGYGYQLKGGRDFSPLP